MKKGILVFFLLAILSYGETLSVKQLRTELLEVGITQENYSKSELIESNAGENITMIIKKMQEHQTEIQSLIESNAEKNFRKISKLIDKLEKERANLDKVNLKAKIEISKYLPQEAIELAVASYIKKIDEESAKNISSNKE